MQVPKSPHSARSRAPIDTDGIKWWEQYGNLEPGSDGQYKSKVDDKVTASGKAVRDRSLPKDKILRRWREVQSRARFEAARAAIINSLKTKFSQETNTNVTTITGDNAETETSNANGNRDNATQTILKLLPAREGLTTPRSARAPVARRTGTLPHQRLKREKSLDSPPEMDSPGGSVGSDLRRQNEELRARLAGESADHRRRLDAYRRAQQGQAALVSRLQAKDFSEKKKRNRVPNFTTEEKMILTQLVNEKKNILDSKLTDGPSIVRKKMAWEALTLAYNSNLSVHKRDTATLKRAWDNLKAMTRKVRRARAIERTVDGPVLPPQPPPQQVAIMNMVEQACPAIMCEIYNPYDSDAVTRASNNPQPDTFQLSECQMGDSGQAERTPDQLYECQIREGVTEDRAPNRLNGAPEPITVSSNPLNDRRRRAPARTNDILIRREAALRAKAMEMKLKLLKLKLDTRASKTKRTELLLEAAQLEVEARRKDSERAEMLRQAAQLELEFQRRRLSQADNQS